MQARAMIYFIRCLDPTGDVSRSCAHCTKTTGVCIVNAHTVIVNDIGLPSSAWGPGRGRHGKLRITTSDGVPPFPMQRPHLVNPIGQHTTRTAPRRVATETFLPGAQEAEAERLDVPQ